MKKNILLLFMFFLVSISEAKVTLPSIFKDNMVLQQNTNVTIWGKATPKSTVQIIVGWTKTKYTASVKEDGTWITKLPTPAAGGPYSLSFKEEETLTLSNVLIGEVWFCSGQSNMEMPMKGFSSQPVSCATDRIIGAKTTKPIRMCLVKRTSATYPQDTVSCNWYEHTREAVAETSATAYFFAETLQNALDIPIGIIVSDWGGTKIEAWMTRQAIEEAAPNEFNFDHLGEGKDSRRCMCAPETLYDGQVAPLAPFSIKGMIWYQGESNRGKHEQYTRLQTAYVKMMRDKFQSPDAGFYFVQIAPFPYNDKDSFMSGYFCEAQAATLKTIPHSAMATTVDVGEYQTIHPCKKIDVGKRLAYLALSKDYGFTEIEAEAPSYKEMSIDGNKIIIKLTDCKCGISPISDEITGFEIAAEDKVFHAAKAHRTGHNSVTVSSEEVDKPVAVRYCFRNYQVGNLSNNFGIPVGPFRTDNWPMK